MPVKPIPDGYHSATPYLIVSGAARAIEFYQKAFGASELACYPAPDGRVGHAEIRVGDSVIMLADPHPEIGHRDPLALGGTPVSIMLYVEDVDAVFRRALIGGAQEMRAVADQFYGDRSGTLRDPFGHVWTIATHKEDLSPEELQRRAEVAMKQAGSG